MTAPGREAWEAFSTGRAQRDDLGFHGNFAIFARILINWLNQCNPTFAGRACRRAARTAPPPRFPSPRRTSAARRWPREGCPRGAQYLQANPTHTPAQVSAAIVSYATKNVVKNVPPVTANTLAYSPL